jgi:hypothetical protein
MIASNVAIGLSKKGRLEQSFIPYAAVRALSNQTG